MSSGLRSARSPGLIESQWAAVTAAKRIGNAIVRKTAAASDQRVERRECSFVHTDLCRREPLHLEQVRLERGDRHARPRKERLQLARAGRANPNEARRGPA